MKPLIQRLRRAVLLQDGAGMTDAQLLECFIERDDEAAFEALMRFHGPMVFGVCQRVLANHHDAEEAFQATFLVLARKAGSISERQTVANWLFSVAHRTALNARRSRAKRVVKETTVATIPEAAIRVQDQWSEMAPLLDEELNRLPDKYRTPVLLCDLEGKSQKEAARQVGCPEGTLSSRLTRARSLLANRLTQRGLVFSAGGMAMLLSENAASASVPISVTDSIIEAARMSAVSQAVATGVISSNVAALTEGTVKSMSLTNLKNAAVVALLVFVGIGGVWLFYRMPTKEEVEKVSAESANRNAESEPLADELAIQGKWTLVKCETTDNDSERDEEFQATLKSGMIQVRFSADTLKFDGWQPGDFKFTLDSSKQPKGMALEPIVMEVSVQGGPLDKKGAVAAIYQLSGDELKICLRMPEDAEPPVDFDIRHSKLAAMLLTLKRNKDVPKVEPHKRELEKLQGTWTAVAAEPEDQKARNVKLSKETTLEISGSRFVYMDAASGNIVSGTLRIDSTRDPKVMDWTDTKSTVLNSELGEANKFGIYKFGIYELDGDTLKICQSRLRVTTYSGASFIRGSGMQILNTFRRVKKSAE